MLKAVLLCWLLFKACRSEITIPPVIWRFRKCGGCHLNCVCLLHHTCYTGRNLSDKCRKAAPPIHIYLHSYPCFLSVEKALQDVNDEKMTQLSRRRPTKKGLLAPTATCRSPKRKKIRRYEAKPRNNPTVVCLIASAPLSQEEQTTNLLKSLTSRISTCRCVYIS